MDASRLARLAAFGAVVAFGACGGGGGGSSGIGLEDLNQDGRVIVLCFGDSITRGVGDGPTADSLPPAPAGYPARLQSLLLPETKLPLTVIDDGKPGERTANGLVRLRRDLERNTPDYTLLLEGTNDVEDGHTNRALANMQLMIDSVFQTGGMPLLGTITPSCCAHKNQLPEGAVIAYNDQLRAIALNDSIPIVDFYRAFTAAPNPDSNSDPDAPYDSTLGLIHVPEGLHPTPNGYDLMAATARALF